MYLVLFEVNVFSLLIHREVITNNACNKTCFSRINVNKSNHVCVLNVNRRLNEKLS